MNYASTILVNVETPNELLDIFKPELKSIINDRASYTIEVEKETLKFLIQIIDLIYPE